MKLLLLALLFFGVQDKSLPDYGNISDLKGMKKVYVVADSSEQRNANIKALSKAGFEVVNSADNADFFLEHKMVQETSPRMSLVKTFATELTAYTTTGEKRHVAWSKTKKQQYKMDDASLVKDFIKALQKL